jgi:hypothetical protein
MANLCYRSFEIDKREANPFQAGNCPWSQSERAVPLYYRLWRPSCSRAQHQNSPRIAHVKFQWFLISTF